MTTEEFKNSLRQSLRRSRELGGLRNPRVQQAMRFNQRVCDQRGIPHEFDRAWALLQGK